MHGMQQWFGSSCMFPFFCNMHEVDADVYMVRCCGGGGLQVRVKFEQIFMSKPLVTEADGEAVTLFPKEARLRNLT
jgi:hypothetical protein